MKKHIFGLIFGVLALSAFAQDVAVQSVDAPAGSAEAPQSVQPVLPEGVVTESHPIKRAYLVKAGTELAVFRPSANMPEVTNEDLLRGMSDSGKTPGSVSQVIGYLPKLKVLPCDKGCSGSDYDEAVREFIKGYRGNGKHFQERGEMVVQVRWFNVRPFLMRQLPYSADLFGVSFILEGKLVSLGRQSGVGISVSADELAGVIGGRLAVELAYTLGVGSRPSFLSPLKREAAMGLAYAVLEAGAKVDGVLGVEDVRSRIEPATEAHKHLLPAIDGILPGEYAPLDKMAYINSLFF